MAYAEIKWEYNKIILQAKRKFWRELVDNLHQDVWELPYRIIREKIGQRRLGLTGDTIAKAIRSLFPAGTSPARPLTGTNIEDTRPSRRTKYCGLRGKTAPTEKPLDWTGYPLRSSVDSRRAGPSSLHT